MEKTAVSPYSPQNPYAIKGEHVREELLALVREDARSVLSVGCGTCATEFKLTQKGIEVWGLDIVPGSLSIANSRVANVVIGDIETDDLASIPHGYFDVIIFGDVLEHLRFPHIALRKARQWLKNGGDVIVSVPNFSNYTVLWDLAVKRTFDYQPGGIRDIGHYRIFTRKNLAELLTKEGFTITDVSFLRPIDARRPILMLPIRAAIRIAPFLNDYFVQTWVLRSSPGSVVRVHLSAPAQGAASTRS